MLLGSIWALLFHTVDEVVDHHVMSFFQLRQWENSPGNEVATFPASSSALWRCMLTLVSTCFLPLHRLRLWRLMVFPLFKDHTLLTPYSASAGGPPFPLATSEGCGQLWHSRLARFLGGQGYVMLRQFPSWMTPGSSPKDFFKCSPPEKESRILYSNLPHWEGNYPQNHMVYHDVPREHRYFMFKTGCSSQFWTFPRFRSPGAPKAISWTLPTPLVVLSRVGDRPLALVQLGFIG